jgi:uncharacterized protein (DUF2336 family)
MPQNHPLFAELEATLTHGGGSQRFSMLRRMTDLFLAGSQAYSDEQIVIFDGLIGRLIEKIERQALVELSGRLAPVERGPADVIGRLSRDDDIAISGPILEQSSMLTDNDLVDIARTKSQAHLSAIAGRRRINEPVTDVLIDRGDSEVAQKVTRNSGARFSRFGFNRAVKRAEKDESLALAVASRSDLPPEMFETLVSRATAAVRERLLANARPEVRAHISQVLASVSREVARAEAPKSAKAETGHADAPAPKRQDRALLKSRISKYVASRNTTELINVFAQYCEVPVKAVKDLVDQGSDEGLLILGKGSGMGWPELQDVLSVTMPAKIKSPEAINALFAKFANLSAANAQRAIGFIRTNTA